MDEENQEVSRIKGIFDTPQNRLIHERENEFAGGNDPSVTVSDEEIAAMKAESRRKNGTPEPGVEMDISDAEIEEVSNATGLDTNLNQSVAVNGDTSTLNEAAIGNQSADDEQSLAEQHPVIQGTMSFEEGIYALGIDYIAGEGISAAWALAEKKDEWDAGLDETQEKLITDALANLQNYIEGMSSLYHLHARRNESGLRLVGSNPYKRYAEEVSGIYDKDTQHGLGEKQRLDFIQYFMRLRNLENNLSKAIPVVDRIDLARTIIRAPYPKEEVKLTLEEEDILRDELVPSYPGKEDMDGEAFYDYGGNYGMEYGDEWTHQDSYGPLSSFSTVEANDNSSNEPLDVESQKPEDVAPISGESDPLETVNTQNDVDDVTLPQSASYDTSHELQRILKYYPERPEANNFTSASGRDFLKDIKSFRDTPSRRILNLKAGPFKATVVENGQTIEHRGTIRNSHVELMAEQAKRLGWTTVELSGSKEAKKSEAWLQLSILGIDVTGYAPTPSDKIRLENARIDVEKQAPSKDINLAISAIR